MKILNERLLNIIGLLTMAGILCMPAFFAEAKFSNTRSSLKVDGVIVGIEIGKKGNGNLTVSTSGSSDITVEINSKTRFSKVDSLDDLNTGDQIYIRAKIRDGKNSLARKIKKWGDEGYGYGYSYSKKTIYETVGDKVKITKGKIVDVNEAKNIFTVETNVTKVIFTVDENTKFRKGNFGSNLIGKNIKVRGIDNGTDFIATKVKIK